MAVALCFGFVSCKKDKVVDDIQVMPSTVNLASAANSSGTFNIVYSGNWTVVGASDWLSVSSASGSGTATITVTVLEANTSSASRSCDLAIVGNGSTAVVTVTQEKETAIEVNPKSISLLSAANSMASISIEYEGNWSITGIPDWLNLSSTSGKGRTNVNLTAISANDSSTERSCELSINGASTSTTLAVTQLAGLQSGCEVNIIDKVVLSDSFAVKMTFGKNASYFYAGYLNNSAAGWTDERIVETLMSDDDFAHDVDGAFVFSDLVEEGQKIILCAVAFDKNGKRGEVHRENMTIPTTSNNPPKAFITDMAYSDDLWYWTTTISATANEYYMLCYQGDWAYYYAAYFTPAEMGLIFKDKLNDLTSYVQSQDWTMNRNSTELFICTWARRDKVWSDVLTTRYGYISEDENYISSAKSQANTKNVLDLNRSKVKSHQEYQRLLKDMVIVRPSKTL